jgi:hypothetical protein
MQQRCSNLRPAISIPGADNKNRLLDVPSPDTRPFPIAAPSPARSRLASFGTGRNLLQLSVDVLPRIEGAPLFRNVLEEIANVGKRRQP